MMKSNINPSITYKMMLCEQENLYLERKSSKTKVSKIANEVIGMLNADGGTVIIGVSDDGIVEGVDKKIITALPKMKFDYISPTPNIFEEEVSVDDKNILLLHVQPDYENMFERKDNGQVYRRVGDSNRGPLSNEEIDKLRYDKLLRKFEDQVCKGFSYHDFDEQSINKYKEEIGYDGNIDDLLVAKALANRTKDGIVYKNSAVLLFAKNSNLWIPSSRVRYVRYSGKDEGSGVRYNVIKDRLFEGNILTLIPEIRDFLRDAIDDYYYLDIPNGVFERVPEYPEGAWLEGVVNAIIHRSYNIQGNNIYIKHFDNRLEISNSGPLPAQVNVNNIRNTRFSRNPRIANVLYDMKYVRELNEGVNRIYDSMKALNLSDPIYTDVDSIVTLTLENKVAKNRFSVNMDIMERIMLKWGTFSDTQKSIITCILAQGEITINELVKLIGVTDRAIRSNLKNLISNGFIEKKTDKKRDKNAKYAIRNK